MTIVHIIMVRVILTLMTPTTIVVVVIVVVVLLSRVDVRILCLFATPDILQWQACANILRAPLQLENSTVSKHDLKLQMSG